MWAAIIGGVIGFSSGLYNVSKGNRELTKAFKKQMKVVMQNYNYNQNALNQEERYALDNAKQQLFQLELNAIQNNSTVEAALAETGTEGRTSSKIKQSISGQVERQKTAKIDNYYLQTDQIRSKKDALYIETDRAIQQARKNLESQYTYGIQAALQVADSTAKGAAMGAFAGGVASSMMGSAGSAGVTAGGTGLSFGEAFMANAQQYGSMFQAMNFLSSSANSISTNNRRGYSFF